MKPSPCKHIATGKMGEAIALQYLIEQHFCLVSTNYRCISGEIDIIVQKYNKIHFIEVKTRKSLAYGHPVEAYTLTKQQKILRTAWHFLNEHYADATNRPSFQFDLIAIYLDEKGSLSDLHYYENAIHE